MREGLSRDLTAGAVSRPSRRAVIGGAAAGAAAAWAAPAILTFDAAAAQGTCVPFSVDWADHETSINDLASNPFPVAVDIQWQLDVSYSNAGMTSGGQDAVGYALSAPLGGQTSDFIEMQLHPNNPDPGGDTGADGEYTELTFVFTDTLTAALAPVQDLSFTLLDIDFSAGDWQDDVQLYASLNGTPVLLAPGDYTIVNNTVVSASVGPTYDEFTGVDGPVPNIDTDGNVQITYSGLIDTLVVRFTALSGIQAEQIGISGLTGCIF
jgi:hypothetical protein